MFSKTNCYCLFFCQTKSDLYHPVGTKNLVRFATKAFLLLRLQEHIWCLYGYFLNELIVFSIIVVHSRNWASLMTNGGAKRIVSPWVGFASKPLSRRRIQTSIAENPYSRKQRKKRFQKNRKFAYNKFFTKKKICSIALTVLY